MEIRAYLEGIGRKWWLVALILLFSWWVGGVFAANLTPNYTASSTILLNDRMLANSAFLTGAVQLSIPAQHEGLVLTADAMSRIVKTYPRLSRTQLQSDVIVSADQTNQLLLITVTDISPFATADIANFLAKNFVRSQTTAITEQLHYYRLSLQQSINRFNDSINRLNTQIVAATPPLPLRGPIPALTPQQNLIIGELQTQVNQDKRNLYADQQALNEIQQALPQLSQVYTILQQAAIPDVPNYSPYLLSTSTLQIIAAALGLLLATILIICLDFFTPFVRHRGELLRIIGIPVTTEVPQLRQSEQQRILEVEGTLFKRRIKPLRLLGATMSALATKKQGHTVILTSPSTKRHFAALLAAFQAYNGLKTLLIDADFTVPSLHEQIQAMGPSDLQTARGLQLSFIRTTSQPNLFLLPATDLPSDNTHVTSQALIDLLPELQSVFDIILIDTPPLDDPITHQLTTKAAQVLMFVKKRRDTLKTLKKTRVTCDTLKLNPHYVLLT